MNLHIFRTCKMVESLCAVLKTIFSLLISEANFALNKRFTMSCQNLLLCTVSYTQHEFDFVDNLYKAKFIW